MAALGEDIKFLKLCLKYGVTPKSHVVSIKSGLSLPSNLTKSVEETLIRTSVKKLHAKLASTTLKAYNAHLQLAATENCAESTFFKIQRGYECEKERKRTLLRKKLSLLIKNSPHTSQEKPTVSTIPNQVINKSSTSFNKDEMDLLNKGWNYAVKTDLPVEHTVVDVEGTIKFMGNEAKDEIRHEMSKAMAHQNRIRKSANQREIKIVRELKKKPVYYLKADKGNMIVIMDKHHYDNLVMEKLTGGNYFELRNDPLPGSIKRVEKALKECSLVVGNPTRLRMPNPSLPRIRCQPKIHKPGNEMREIIADSNSPTYNIAKWLVDECQKLGSINGNQSVKNSKELIERLSAVGTLADNERLVSFDVKALFPSTPETDQHSTHHPGYFVPQLPTQNGCLWHHDPPPLNNSAH
ncbi:uncharacterized protein LOC119659073 [Hermetia illucens]|uniref:uncharacterized protein LOC119659073 n=1 Tax=Hermetia illucens TaxID=343691 RepID=UPI0018CC136E|nr:uncharacterized protein LOC119659073 [Hermetia illucens]